MLAEATCCVAEGRSLKTGKTERERTRGHWEERCCHRELTDWGGRAGGEEEGEGREGEGESGCGCAHAWASAYRLYPSIHRPTLSLYPATQTSLHIMHLPHCAAPRPARWP